MDDRDRPVDEVLEHHAGLDDRAGIGLLDRRADLRDIDQRIEDAAEAEIEP